MTPTPPFPHRDTAERILAGKHLTDEALHALSAQVGTLSDAECRELNDAVDAYVEQHREHLADDVETESALLTLKQKLLDHEEAVHGVSRLAQRRMEVTLERPAQRRKPQPSIFRKMLSLLGMNVERQSVPPLPVIQKPAVRTPVRSVRSARERPVQKPSKPTISKKPKPQPAPEKPKSAPVMHPKKPMQPLPEPVEKPVLQEPEPVPKMPEVRTALVSLDDERLEDENLFHTGFPIGIDGIPIVFEKRNNLDEEEYLLNVGGKIYRAHHAQLPISLSQMLKMARMSYGELYLHGTLGIGGLSGQGYIMMEELRRIISLLMQNDLQNVETDIEFFDKERTVKSRKGSTVRVRFEQAG